MLAELLDDLQAEHDDLASYVRTAELGLAVPAEPWDVRDTVCHLMVTNDKALLSATDAAAFAGEVDKAAKDPQGYLDEFLTVGADLDKDELVQRWDASLAALGKALGQVADGVKLPWYGPPMSPASMATARIMEYWAHGQDVVDALGVRRAPTTRLRHICHLGVRTRGFAYAIRGLPLPEGDVRVSLTAPDGSLWEWGSGDDAVVGSAESFCLRVTQRRHRADTDLVATGPLADAWLDIAQCFAGLPSEGRVRS